MAERIVFEGRVDSIAMPEMNNLDSIPLFLTTEKTLRMGEASGITMAMKLPPNWQKLAEPLVDLHRHKWCSTTTIGSR